jgi:hypothetical protein
LERGEEKRCCDGRTAAGAKKGLDYLAERMGLEGIDQPGDLGWEGWAVTLEAKGIRRCCQVGAAGGAQGGWILVERGWNWMLRCPRGLDPRGERMELDGEVPKGAGFSWREDGTGW